MICQLIVQQMSPHTSSYLLARSTLAVLVVCTCTCVVL